MKTIREWLQTLPEPYRGLALFNLEVRPMVPGCADALHVNLAEAIFAAFKWQNSPERYDFWYGVYSNAKTGECGNKRFNGVDCTLPEETT